MSERECETVAVVGGGCVTVAVSLLLGLLLLCLTGCKTVREVPVVVEHSTERVSVDVVRDTVLRRDSVYHYVQGDTVVIERWHHTVSVRERGKADTVVTVREVPVEVATVREVERPLSWWQRGLMWLGVLLLGGGLLWGVRSVKQ